MMLPTVSPVSAPTASVDVRVVQRQVAEEDAVQGVVVVLPGVRQQAVEVSAALLMTSDRRMTSGRVPTMIRSLRRPSSLNRTVLSSTIFVIFNLS